MIAVLKSKGVPVLWVGLPAVRGAKATADALFLDSLYREAAAKAGITYVDVWDGFVDEAGRFLQQGPDFEGQIRRLRSYDGVYFTRPGARKLAHYVEREITRLLAGRSAPISLPSEPATPDANAQPGQPAPRPLAGPILPLVASSVGTDQLLGGPGSRPAAVDALAARTLVKGEPLAPPAGRADDFAWPRREVGREQAKGETPVAAVSPDGTIAAPGAPPKPKKPAPLQPGAPVQSGTPSSTPSLRNFFGLGSPPRQLLPAPRARGWRSAPAGQCRAVGVSAGTARQSHAMTSPVAPGAPQAPGVTMASAFSCNTASGAAAGAADATSASPAQSRSRLRSAARRADYPAPAWPRPAIRRARYRRCSRRRPWHS